MTQLFGCREGRGEGGGQREGEGEDAVAESEVIDEHNRVVVCDQLVDGSCTHSVNPVSGCVSQHGPAGVPRRQRSPVRRRLSGLCTRMKSTPAAASLPALAARSIIIIIIPNNSTTINNAHEW